MARLVKKPGDVFKMALSDTQHGYAQWLPDETARVFSAALDRDLTIDEIAGLPVAFRVLVFKDTPNKYGWVKVGNSPVPSECANPQHYSKQDPITGAISIYFEGHERTATYKQAAALEVCAIWAHPHIVERLNSVIGGSESSFLNSIKLKPNA